MTSEAKFSPDWRTPPPSRTILDLLARKGMSLADFDSAARLTPSSLGDVVGGFRSIDRAMALALERHLGGSCEFWISRERQYRESLSSSGEQSLAQYLRQILPLRDMLAYGWLTPFRRGDSEENAAIRFFGVQSKEEFKARYDGLAEAISFRRSEAFELEVGSLAAWMRAVELQAEEIECRDWSKAKLRENLERVRRLTWERDPAKFMPALRSLCSEAGVAMAFVRAPRGCPVSGATKFLSPTKALVALTFRHLTDDHFWFSFFHEVGHLLLHDERETFIESQSIATDCLEAEANDFASSTIVPSEFVSRLERLSANKYEIVRFARLVGVSPGLVVGQLQHRKILRHNQMNRLKRRFAWSA